MADLHDLTIKLGGLTALAQDYPFGLPPVYSMQAIQDQVPGATFSPDDYRDLFYPATAIRLPTGILKEALGYLQRLVPSVSWAERDALYADLEAKAWENWSQITGVHR